MLTDILRGTMLKYIYYNTNQTVNFTLYPVTDPSKLYLVLTQIQLSDPNNLRP